MHATEVQLDRLRAMKLLIVVSLFVAFGIYLIKSLNENENLPFAYTLNNIGMEYYHGRNYPEAMRYYNKALEILPENHPSIAAISNNLALVYLDIGQTTIARKYYEKAMLICRLTLPHNHPYTADALNGLGNLYGDLGEFDKAKEYFLMSLEIKRKILPENHSSIVDTLKSIENIDI